MPEEPSAASAGKVSITAVKVLKNRANCPLYLLCFAAGNPKGAPIAVGIANHILKVA